MSRAVDGAEEEQLPNAARRDEDALADSGQIDGRREHDRHRRGACEHQRGVHAEAPVGQREAGQRGRRKDDCKRSRSDVVNVIRRGQPVAGRYDAGAQ